MPTYDYQCRSCGAVIEVIHSMLEPGPAACERCGGELRRVLYPTGIIFKGSGFYRNDSRPADPASASKGGGDAATPAPKAGDAGDAGSAPTPPKPSGGTSTTGGSAAEAAAD